MSFPPSEGMFVAGLVLLISAPLFLFYIGASVVRIHRSATRRK